MAKLSGFLSIHSFIDNTTNQDSVIGEQSSFTKTFSNDPQLFHESNVALTLYNLKDLTSAQESQFETVCAAVATALNDIQNVSDDPQGGTLEDRVRTNVEASGDLTLVSIGSGVYHAGTDKDFPDYIQVEYTAGGATGWTFDVWLSNTAFKAEYLPIVYTVIPPIDDLNLIWNSFVAAQTEAADNKDLQTTIERAEQYLAGNIPTGYYPVTLTVFNPNNTSQYFEGVFNVAYNGFAGKDIEGVYQAILDYVIANSSASYDSEEWQVVIPALQPTESFYVVPMWGNKAVENQALSYPMLSPVVATSPSVFTDVASTYFSGFVSAEGQSAVLDKMVFTVSLTKSAGIFILADPGNQLGWNSFLDKFPDYMVIPVNDHNIGQLALPTRQIMNALSDLMIRAQAFTVGDTVNSPYAIESMGGYRYMTYRSGSTVLKVMTRESYEAAQ